MIIPDLTISIVLFKTSLLDIERCFRSLYLYSGSIYIYIIDNSPIDDLNFNKLFSLIDQCEYIHMPSNIGYGSAHNVAIRKAQSLGSKYHLVINADINFSSDVISPMLSYMEENIDVAQMMPKVLNPDGKIQRLCKLVPSPFDLIFRRFLPNKYKNLHNKYFELHDTGYNKIMFVPYLSGCFMLLRQSALKEIGLFDERYFMYPEDIDLTRRLADRYKTIFYPNVFVIHEHGAASHKSIKMFIIHALNLFRYFNKWGWFYDPIRMKLNRKTLSQFF